MSSEPLPAAQLGSRPTVRWWSDRRFWLGMSISVACLVLAFRRVQWVDLAAALRSVDWLILALAGLVAVLDQAVRSKRWQVLLTPVGEVSTADSFIYLSIGALANNVLPLRIGEILRAVLLAEKRHLGRSAVFATVVVERVLDVLMLVLAALLLMLAMPLPPAVKRTMLVLGVASAAALVAFWWIAGQASQESGGRLHGWAAAWSRRILGQPNETGPEGSSLLQSLLHKAWSMARSFVDGLGAVRSPRLLARTSFLSVIAWFCSMLYVWLVLRACHLDLPWTAGLMVLVIVNFGAAIPSSPGGLGIVHWLAKLALTPWNVPAGEALSFAILVHAVLFSVTVLVGLICLWHEGLKFGQLTRLGEQQAALADDAPGL